MRLIIKGQPATKKNSMEIRYKRVKGKLVPFIGQSRRYEEYEESALWQLNGVKAELPPPPYNIQCIYYRQNLIHCDLTNLLEATDDILVKAGIISDDWWQVIASHDGSRVFLDRNNPRVEIIITQAKELSDGIQNGK